MQRFAAEAIKAIDALLDSDYSALKGHVELLAPQQAHDFPLKNIPLRRVGLTSGYAWEQFEFPLHARGALLLNLCMLGPLAVRHQIVVVHDATVEALPENFSPTFNAAYKFIIPRLCQRADLIVTVSEFSRREIAKWYGGNIAAMPVCHEGGDHIKAAPADLGVLQRLVLARPQVLPRGWRRFRQQEHQIGRWPRSIRRSCPDVALVLTGAREPRIFGEFDLSDFA